ncbi:HNH endonuclease [Microbacterium resistens]|uniref:HNH endonuclease n=1 Tax=Microbacterium resistens TaxID=156977 RepID=A0ABY3RNT2_9MICO|nr:HNH endonuclease signature motif containing protein [Microbacterium resistens]UGS25532.1 HNH endonuclease [Microbacterium resistens]
MVHNSDLYLARSGEIVERCRELDARIARLEAEKAELLGERVRLLLDEVPPGSAGFEAAERSMFAEVSAGLKVTRFAATKALATGFALSDRFPATASALRNGAISRRHAEVIVDGAAPLGVSATDAHRAYEGQVVPYASAETPARTQAFARSVVAAVAPRTAVERHARARDDRRVTVQDVEDGMSWLSILMPSVLAHAVHERVTGISRGIRALRAAGGRGAFGHDAFEHDAFDHDESGHDAVPNGVDSGGAPGAARESGRLPLMGEEVSTEDEDEVFAFEQIVAGLGEPRAAERTLDRIRADERTLDQIRADVVTDLLLAARTDTLHATGTAAIRPTVQVTIAATTLAGVDDRPAELDDHGPVHPDLVRALAGGAEHWERLFLSPTGMITRTDSYAPTERMRRHLRARDRHCRFPGCRIPARASQIDHNHDHARGGPTTIDNLAHLCPAHHALKHPDQPDRWRWTARQRDDGSLVWTDPTGHVHTDTAPPRVQFT